MTTAFNGLLTPAGGDGSDAGVDTPAPVLHDINLDQIIDAVTGDDPYDLAPLYRRRIVDTATVVWRQQTAADLDDQSVAAATGKFCDGIETVAQRVRAAATLSDRQHAVRWHLNAIDLYVHAVRDLADDLTFAQPHSDGLFSLLGWLDGYLKDPGFVELADGSAQLLRRLGEVRYDLLVRGGKVTVGQFDDEPDFRAHVLRVFRRFREGEVAAHDMDVRANAGLDGITAQVLNLVARLYPDLFADIEQFCTGHHEFRSPVVIAVDRDLRFYRAWSAYIAPLRSAGLPFTYPDTADGHTLSATSTFDLALAAKLTGHSAPTVTNDVSLNGHERILVVSGPNQGGKTTLARSIGQMYHVAALGLAVAGQQVSLTLPDQIFSHFERREHLADQSGKLEDEVRHVRQLLDEATSRSVVIMNEMFSSTTLADATVLSERVLTALTNLDAIAVCVTFIDELSTLNDKTVSVVATVDDCDPAVRTFHLVRRPADGRAYALAIAAKYRLTRELLGQRLQDAS